MTEDPRQGHGIVPPYPTTTHRVVDSRLTPVPMQLTEIKELLRFLTSPGAEAMPDSARLTMLCQLAGPLLDILEPKGMALLGVSYPVEDYPPSADGYARLCFVAGHACAEVETCHALLGTLRRRLGDEA